MVLFISKIGCFTLQPGSIGSLSNMPRDYVRHFPMYGAIVSMFTLRRSAPRGIVYDEYDTALYPLLPVPVRLVSLCLVTCSFMLGLHVVCRPQSQAGGHVGSA